MLSNNTFHWWSSIPINFWNDKSHWHGTLIFMYVRMITNVYMQLSNLWDILEVMSLTELQSKMGACFTFIWLSWVGLTQLSTKVAWKNNISFLICMYHLDPNSAIIKTIDLKLSNSCMETASRRGWVPFRQGIPLGILSMTSVRKGLLHIPDGFIHWKLDLVCALLDCLHPPFWCNPGITGSWWYCTVQGSTWPISILKTRSYHDANFVGSLVPGEIAKYKVLCGILVYWKPVLIMIHDANFVITGGTISCLFDKLWCRQWRQSWHHGHYWFSV